MKATKYTHSKRFIISCLSLIFFLCSFSSINEIRFNRFQLLARCAFSNSSSGSSSLASASLGFSSSSDEDIRILIGILTLPNQVHRRHFLRMVYGIQKSEGGKVDFKFVFCNITKEDQKVLVALEIMQYNDIIILDCKENMDNGKTYAYFSSLPDIFNSTKGPYPPYHYVTKADDDTFFKLDNLVKSLKPLPREDLYYGFVAPCPSMNTFVHYMAGMGYLVSWDVVEWVRESSVPKSHLVGPEDKVFGEWLRDGDKGKNRFNAKWSMYDYPEPPTRCTHELWPDTIAVHKLKTQERWIKTLEYFNFTKDLKPSKLYHIP